MAVRLDRIFDPATLARGRDYHRRGLVVSVEAVDSRRLASSVSNGRGTLYDQTILLGDTTAEGYCSCPVGQACKHVAAALLAWSDSGGDAVTGPLQGWLTQVERAAVPPGAAAGTEDRPEAYPSAVKDRLLYVFTPRGVTATLDLYKGRIAADGTRLTATMRRYDGSHLMRGSAPAKFIRPVDLRLLPALALARLWDGGHGYALPDLLRPNLRDLVDLLRQVCETGRLLYANTPDAGLAWSDTAREPRLVWRMEEDGRQRLDVVDTEGRSLALRALGEATLWIDRSDGRLGLLSERVPEDVLRLVDHAPHVTAEQAAALETRLPATVGGMAMPRPRKLRATRRSATHRVARLTLGREVAQDGPRFWGAPVHLPTLTLSFLYDGQEVTDGLSDPVRVEAEEIVTLARDHAWEDACAARLMEAGALAVEELEVHWPGERMMDCDFVFADGEMNTQTLEISEERAALTFAHRVLPELRRDGWEIVETPRWPYSVREDEASLSVTTRSEAGSDPGEGFQGNDWFSLGFQAEIDGAPVDVAPIVAAFLEQIRADWDTVPDLETLTEELSARPVYLEAGKRAYVPVDLSPLAPLLHLFLTQQAEMGALHPTDAEMARLTEAALDGSSVTFSDKAGILPLAESLRALDAADSFRLPAGLHAELRAYQARGAAWMGSLLEAGFGGVLADDMGLGKTVQTLALLQARREAGAPGPALLIVPTSLLHSWQTQAARFTPELRCVVLHGPDRAKARDAALAADLALTTYPLLARDRSWLAAQDWPVVILDEAQTLKNPASQTAKALRELPAAGRIALTGTPLENSLQDLWTLMDWINPGLLGDRKRFQALFRTPIEKHGDAAAQARLNRRLRPFLLRRTKEEVAAELPPRTEILERVDLPKAQQALYESVRAAMDARVREAIDRKGLAAARITVLDALLKLRQVCCDPALVPTDAARAVTESAKRARLRALLDELLAEGRRVLVFSQFVEMLRLVEADLDAAGVQSLMLTGRTQRREDVLEAFARGDAPVFLLSLKAGGVGLTLTEADTVILYDPWWNPAVERQAMDRAHRIGQDKPVFVHRLVAAGTVEEKILELQARKQALADALFEEGAAAESLLDEATLRDLFAPLGT